MTWSYLEHQRWSKDFELKLDEHFKKEKSKITYGDANDDNGVQFLGSVIKKEKNGTVTMSQTKRIEDKSCTF